LPAPRSGTLPSDFIRDSAISADCFRRLLKAYLFAECYSAFGALEVLGDNREIEIYLLIASHSQRVSLMVIPFCLSGCLSVTPLLLRTVGRSAALADGVRQRSGRGCYSCHCERDASCHMTCLYLFSVQFGSVLLVRYERPLTRQCCRFILLIVSAQQHNRPYSHTAIRTSALYA